MDVIVLAGAKSDPELLEASGAEYRCEIEIGGRAMLDIVLAACEGLGPTVVVGPRAREGASLAAPGERLLQSMRNGLGACSGQDVLFVTADLPYIEARHVADFLAAVPKGVGLAYSVVPVQACYDRFPGQKRTALKAREGSFTGGNLIYAQRGVVDRLLGLMEAAYAARKSPLRLASLVGFGVAVRTALGQIWPGSLPLCYLEGVFSCRIGAQARAIVLPHPEIATDVDSVAQYRAAMG